MEKEQFDKLLEKISSIESNISLMNANMKMLSNRIVQLMDKLSQSPKSTTIAPPPIASASPMAVLPGSKPIVKTEIIPDSTPQNVSRLQRQMPKTGPQRSVLSYKRVFGFVREDESQVPISDAVVFIYDSSNEVCSSTVTDPAGFWETMLNEGRYVVKITKDNADINKILIVDQTRKEFEVT